MNKRKLSYFSSFLLLSSFACLLFLLSSCDSSQRVVKLDKVFEEVATQLEKNENLKLIGTGGGSTKNSKVFSLSFNYYDEIGIAKGRELLLAATDTLLEKLQGEKIFSSSQSEPISPKNIEIRIFLHQKDGSQPERGKLSVIRSIQGTLSYDITDPRTHQSKMIYKEPILE